MSLPLMPKATAVWLVDNTMLTFDQIAEFCGLHALEVQAIADGEIALNIVAQNPVINGELTQEELDRCIANPRAKLKMAKSDLPQPKARSKGPRYTPVTKRAQKPDAIAYLLKEHPELTDSQIGRLVGTTKPTIQSVRDRTHPNQPNIKPESPVALGFCKQDELDKAVKRAQRAAERAAKEAPAASEAPEEESADQPVGAEAVAVAEAASEIAAPVVMEDTAESETPEPELETAVEETAAAPEPVVEETPEQPTEEPQEEEVEIEIVIEEPQDSEEEVQNPEETPVIEEANPEEEPKEAIQ